MKIVMNNKEKKQLIKTFNAFMKMIRLIDRITEQESIPEDINIENFIKDNEIILPKDSMRVISSYEIILDEGTDLIETLMPILKDFGIKISNRIEEEVINKEDEEEEEEGEEEGEEE